MIYGQIQISPQDTNPGGAPHGVFPEGTAPLLLMHDVYFNGKLDSVSTNRPPVVNTCPEDNRVHTCTIFRATASAKLLDQFNSAMELLVAVRDAVRGELLHIHAIQRIDN